MIYKTESSTRIIIYKSISDFLYGLRNVYL